MQFRGYVKKLIRITKDKNKKVKDPKEIQKLIKSQLKEHFSDCMIIIDEAHNIASSKNEIGDIAKEVVKDVKEADMEEVDDYEEEIEEDEYGIISEKSIKVSDSKFNGLLFSPVIKNVLRNAENLKLVLLTATPIYNEATEIVALINLLLLNDKRNIIKQNEIFDKNMNFKKGGEEMLKVK